LTISNIAIVLHKWRILPTDKVITLANAGYGMDVKESPYPVMSYSHKTILGLNTMLMVRFHTTLTLAWIRQYDNLKRGDRIARCELIGVAASLTFVSRSWQDSFCLTRCDQTESQK